MTPTHTPDNREKDEPKRHTFRVWIGDSAVLVDANDHIEAWTKAANAFRRQGCNATRPTRIDQLN